MAIEKLEAINRVAVKSKASMQRVRENASDFRNCNKSKKQNK